MGDQEPLACCRDIKTQNVFMSAGGLLKLGDFGVRPAYHHLRPACCDGLLLLALIHTPIMSEAWCMARPWLSLDNRLSAGGKGAEQHLPAGQHWRGHAILSESRDLSKQRIQCQGEQAAMMHHLYVLLPVISLTQSQECCCTPCEPLAGTCGCRSHVHCCCRAMCGR